MSIRYKLKRRARYHRTTLDEKHHRGLCMEDGCTEKGRPCFCPDNMSGVPDEFFCSDHAHGAGYCYSCGQFWGGIDSFDFSRSGLCDHCQDQVNADFATGSDEEDEVDPEQPDSCWCGVENPYCAPVSGTCGGMGTLNCFCGGDLCVCHNHGEVECFGCVDCEEEGYSDEDDY